jgi:hypothetical protein
MGSQIQILPTIQGQIAALAQRVSNLETSLGNNHGTISNGNLSVLYADGNVAAAYGIQNDGTFGLWLYPDTTGAYPANPTMKLSGTGLSFYNPSGVEEVSLGELSSGLWGLGVLPYGGSQLQQVGGALSALTADEQQSTASWSNLTGDPSVTVDIGPSGEALVMIGCRISTGGAANQNMEGVVGVQVDGAATPYGYNSSTPLTGPYIYASTAAAGGVSVSGTITIQVTGLSAGTHTFSLLYATANISGGSVGFSGRFVTVQPL